jgi:hypothetical protein
MPSSLQEFVQSIAEVPALLKKAETFCMAFAIEFLKEKSRNFTKINSFYDTEGLVTTYRCNLDGRIYTIKVTPSKD